MLSDRIYCDTRLERNSSVTLFHGTDSIIYGSCCTIHCTLVSYSRKYTSLISSAGIHKNNLHVKLNVENMHARWLPGVSALPGKFSRSQNLCMGSISNAPPVWVLGEAAASNITSAGQATAVVWLPLLLFKHNFQFKLNHPFSARRKLGRLTNFNNHAYRN